MVEVGDKYTFQGTEVTITQVSNNKIHYAGKGQEGVTSLGYYFTHNFYPVKKTTQVFTSGVDKAAFFAEQKAAWLGDKITTKEYQKAIATSKTPSITGVKNGTNIIKEPPRFTKYEDTSLIKLTKKGSTKLYVGVGIIAVVIIFGGFKIFKKVIKL